LLTAHFSDPINVNINIMAARARHPGRASSTSPDPTFATMRTKLLAEVSTQMIRPRLDLEDRSAVDHNPAGIGWSVERKPKLWNHSDAR